MVPIGNVRKLKRMSTKSLSDSAKTTRFFSLSTRSLRESFTELDMEEQSIGPRSMMVVVLGVSKVYGGEEEGGIKFLGELGKLESIF